MRKALVLLLLLTMLCSCLMAMNKGKAARRLADNTSLLQTFTFRGISTLHYRSFALRKYFVLQKADGIRLDVMDSGILGLTNAPLLSLYARDSLELSAPNITQLKNVNPNWLLTPDAVKSILTFPDSLTAHQDTILRKHRVVVNGIICKYDHRYRLIHVDHPASTLKADIRYDSHNLPNLITIAYEGKPALVLEINEVERTANIIPLHTSTDSGE